MASARIYPDVGSPQLIGLISAAREQPTSNNLRTSQTWYCHNTSFARHTKFLVTPKPGASWGQLRGWTLVVGFNTFAVSCLWIWGQGHVAVDAHDTAPESLDQKPAYALGQSWDATCQTTFVVLGSMTARHPGRGRSAKQGWEGSGKLCDEN